jgi:hypothetical protein
LDDNIANLPSNWYYNINTTINGSTLVITGSVRGINTQSNNDNILWLFLIEDPINYATAPGSNGVRDFHSVLRKILPTSSGINCGNGSQSTNINVSYPLSPTFVQDNLYLLAFVQSNGTKVANKGVKVKLGFSTNPRIILPTIPSCLNDTVDVIVTNPSLNGVANAALRMTYNADSLTYVGSSNLNLAFNGMVVNGANGVVTLDWNTSTNQNIAAGNMVNLRFRVNGSSALTWDTLVYPSEFSDVNFDVVPQTFQSGGVTNRTVRYHEQRQICQGQTLQMGGQAFSTGGNYQVVLPGFGTDCDTLVNLTLSVLPTQTSISATTCSNQPYSFDGQNLNVTGVYRDTLFNILGCDSVVTLNLTVSPAYSQTISVVNCPGTSYNFGNQVLTTSGTYTNTFSTVGGCDSVFQLNLTFADSIQIVAQGGSNGFCPGGSLRIGTLSNLQQGPYQWKFNGNIIGTANADTLLVNQAGTYQAEVVTPTCTLYSNILNVSVLNCNQITGDLRYDNTNLTPLAGVPVELKTLLGNVVATDTTDSSGNYYMSGYANGNYILDARIGYNSGGINSTDALLVNRHFTSLISLTPLRARAGDVNGNQITNSVDALLISRRITNLLSSFAVGNYVNDKPTIIAQGNPLSVSMRALSTGDVNGSFIVQPSAPTLVLDTVYGNRNVGTAVVRFTNPGSGVFERGIVWSSSPNPTISSNKSIAGKGGFDYTHSFGIIDLNNIQYARAYARTSAGVFYSPERSFTLGLVVPQAQNAFAIHFSGNWCGPCGVTGIPALYNLDSIYGAQFNGIKVGLNDPFSIPEGSSMAGQYNINAIPAYIAGANFIQSATTWASAINSIVGTVPANVMAGVALRRNRVGDTIFVDTKTKFFQSVPTGNYSLAVFIVENNILLSQAGQSNPLFLHNMVFRGNAMSSPVRPVTGVWGAKLENNNTAIPLGSIYEITFRYVVPNNLNPGVNLNNIKAIAVIFETDNSGKPVKVLNSNEI